MASPNLPVRLVGALFLGTMALCAWATPVEVVSRAVPVPTEHMSCGYRGAAVCPDGAIWVVWTQDARPRYYDFRPLAERANAPDVGVFCRLVTSEGSDIVPPVRIVEPAMDELNRLETPSLFLPIALPDGGVVVFTTVNPLPSTFSEVRRGHRYTSVVAVGRKGEVRRMTFDSSSTVL
jgi:hypothetical protein